MRLDVPGDDRTLRVVHANRAVEKHTGTRPADIVGRLCDEAFPTVRQRGFLVRVMRVMGTGEPEAYEDVYYEDERVAAAFGGQVARVAENTVIIWFENNTRRRQLEAAEARAAVLEQETLRRAALVAELEAANQRAQDALDTYALVASAAEDVLWEIRVDDPNAPFGPETPCQISDRFAEILGCDPSELRHELGLFPEVIHPEDVGRVSEAFRAMQEDPSHRMLAEYRIITRSGEIRHMHGNGRARTDAAGRLRKLAGTIRDITAQKQAEAELRARLALIEQQRDLIEELSTPILEVWEDVIALPVIGSLDGRRAAATMDELLREVSEKGVRFALLDLTGVDVLDTDTAEHLLRIAQAVGLLGAQAIITGIRPAVAQTMVALGIELSSIETRRTLRDGLRECLQRVARERALAGKGQSPGAKRTSGAA